MSVFFEELQRRKVYRVAAAYIIAAGFIIQIASAAFPAWELPNWNLRLLIALLLISFPIALLLAWSYDLTAHGIQATPKAPSGVHQRRNLFLLVATAIILSGGAGFLLLPHMGFHNPITPAWLRLDPVWDQIRNDSRFQQLAAENKP